jgi:hypothetical protein
VRFDSTAKGSRFTTDIEKSTEVARTVPVFVRDRGLGGTAKDSRFTTDVEKSTEGAKTVPVFLRAV